MKSTCSLYKIFAGINVITKKSKDFITLEIASNKSSIVISYFRTLIDVNIFHEEVLTYIKEKSRDSLQDIRSVLPFENSKITNQIEDIQDSILNGYILIQFDTDKLNCLLVNVSKKEKRDITKAEIEYNIVIINRICRRFRCKFKFST